MKSNLDFVGSVVALVSCFCFGLVFFPKSLFLEFNIWIFVLSLEWGTTFSLIFFKVLAWGSRCQSKFQRNSRLQCWKNKWKARAFSGFHEWTKENTTIKILCNETGKAFLYHPQKQKYFWWFRVAETLRASAKQNHGTRWLFQHYEYTLTALWIS